MIDESCHSAAAYVLGALTPAERHAFEDHLAGCAECRATISEIAAIPALLATITTADLAEPPPAPDTLLPSLLREVRRHRRRRFTVAAAGLVAAAAAVSGVVLVSTHNDAPAYSATMRALTDNPVRATVALDRMSWGTRVELACTYTGGGKAWGTIPRYQLVVVNRAGVSRPVSTWAVVPGKTADITGSVEWQPNDIANVQVQTESGVPLLTLHP